MFDHKEFILNGMLTGNSKSCPWIRFTALEIFCAFMFERVAW